MTIVEFDLVCLKNQKGYLAGAVPALNINMREEIDHRDDSNDN